MTRAMSHAGEAGGRDGEAGGRDDAAGESKTDTVGKTASWQQAHQALVRLAKARAGLDFDEGERLLEALRARARRRSGREKDGYSRQDDELAASTRGVAAGGQSTGWARLR